MLQITIPETELYDDKVGEFIYTKETKLKLEHSLISISKWEQHWRKPYINTVEKTREETIDYIKCMTLTQNVDPNAYRCITNAHIKQINEYINNPMTATTFSDKKKSGRREITTNEVIYYQMIDLGIPVEFEKWHLNRLLTLIKVCTSYREPQKKRNKKDIMRDYKAINKANRAKFKSKG